jgi:predicted permease
MNALRFLDNVRQDLSYGVRLLRKNRTFSIIAILTLALGTGANTAIFQLVNSIRFRALPVEKPQELVSIRINTHGKGRVGRAIGRRPFFSEPLWQSLRAEQQAFSDLFVWGPSDWNIALDGEFRSVRGLYVSGNYFQGLGVSAHVGRVITEADDQKGCGVPGAVISYGFWRTHYNGNPAVLGQTITLDGRSFEILGVTPPPFFGTEVGRSFDVAVPLCAEPIIRGTMSGLGKSDVAFLDMMGRLQPGWTARRADAHLASISPGIFASTVPPRYTAEAANDYKGFTFSARTSSTGVLGIRDTYATQLWILLGATGFVLLTTCANLANLMLARASVRQREIAVRLAIGAARGRIVRQMLSESAVLAVLGSAAGMLIAQWLSQALVASFSTESTRLFVDLSPDWRTFAFVASLAAIACLLFGLSPALQATGMNPLAAMQATARYSSDTRKRVTVRRTLVVMQLALSLVLVIGAVLFGRSLRNLATVDPGFRDEGILAVSIDTRRSPIDATARPAAYRQVVERIRAVPGVEVAAETFIVPMSGSGWNEKVVIGGEPKDVTNVNRVGADYFRATGTALMAGRTFGPEDRPGAIETAIVNESFARKYLRGSDPVGQTFQLEAPPGQPQSIYHVIGVVRDTKYIDLREEFTPIVYFDAAQGTETGPFLDVVLRSDLPQASLTSPVTRAIREVVPGAVVAYKSVQTYVRDSLVTERVMAALSGFFGMIAIAIAAIGLYGVMSTMVSRRRVEIGIRIALGADPRRVVTMVLRESAVVMAWGVAIGTVLTLVVTRWATSLLYELTPSDPVSFAVGAGGLALVGLLAAWLPARRAAGLAPTMALRED